ncbi:ribokinase [Phreatobacter stygius]|uniref:Ribokinase n=2 Tax=Phreatobacter stygius TaxID=1940610 RepID=A0A4D7BJJ4_9HYPH|nr:ribokinase [Phreatobacter stygius]
MIVVFGSLNVDLVARVPVLPSAGETVLGPDYVTVPGGKGANQALAARRAGAEVVMVGAVGRDGFAEAALAALAAAGVDISRVARVEAPTGAAFIAVDPAGRNQIVVAAGANARASAAALDDLEAGKGDILMLQWEVPGAEILAAAQWAKARELTVVLNRAPAGPVPAELMALVDVVIVNEHEILALAEGLGMAAVDAEAIACEIDRRLGVTAIVTLGAAGALAWGGGVRCPVPALKVDVVDTTAAGDAFCGAFAAALAQGRGLTSAVEHGSAAGSLACTGFGAQPSLPARGAIEQGAAQLATRDIPLIPKVAPEPGPKET